MALDQKFFKKSTAGSGTDQEQGLFIYADANDIDSYDGDSDLWYDIIGHEVNTPLTDNDDNLEIHIDASNTSSYGGSGSTITDISTNGYSFSTHGNATFGSDVRGYFTLDGSDDGLRTTNAVTGFSGDVTFEWWFNASEASNFTILHANPLSNDTGINGIYIGNAGGAAGAIEMYRKTTGGASRSSYSLSSVTGLANMASEGWVHFVITITSANVVKYYKDGTYQGTVTMSGSGNTHHDTYNFVSIGGYNNTSYEFAGQMGCFRMYSEILTATQIGQNFRAGNFLSYSSIIQNPNILTDLRPSDYSSGATWSDSSTKSNNATLNNFSSTVADYYDEEIGDFFDLDGSNDYFSTSITKNWASIPFSVEMWFNTDSRNGEYLWGLNDTAGNGVGVSTRGSGNSYQLMFLGSGVIVSAGVVQTNRWYHLVFTSDGTTKKAYLDGSFVASGTTTINSAANGKAFIFGRYGTYSGAYFNGKIGHTRVYEGALTAEQVAQNYLATKNKYPNGNNFDLYNNPTFQNSSTPYYFRFDSANDEARVSSVDIDVSMGFTVSIYVKRHTAVSGYAQPFRITGTGYTSYLFLVAGYNDVIYYSSSGTGNSLSTYGNSGNWTDNSSAWRNIIFTRESTPGSTTNRGEIYVNGSSHATAANLSAITNITNIYVNRDASYPTSRNSQVDVGLIKIWKKPFSDAEALAEYNATKDIYGL